MKSLALAMAAVLLLSNATKAQNTSTAPPALKGVGIQQRLGESVPLDLTFNDERGCWISLAQCTHQRPVLLALVYYRCPMLCNMTLNQLASSLTTLHESAGENFDIITVSFDPAETPTLAASKKQQYLKFYSRSAAGSGWHFLTGSKASIDHLAQSVGFSYRWDERTHTFAHSTALIVLTPQGKISRYFLGVDYPPTELRHAISDAAEQTVANPTPQVLFYCFQFDPTTGRYGLIISRVMRLLGIATVLALTAMIVTYARREHRQKRLAAVKERNSSFGL